MEANVGKKKDLVASVGAVAAFVNFVIAVLKKAPGLTSWLGSFFKRRKRVYIWMLTGNDAAMIKEFKEELGKVADGKINCIVTGLDVRLLEIKIDSDGLLVPRQEG